jgi:hypothetical protein
MKIPRDIQTDRRVLAFLRRGPLVRRSRGWRFGTASVADVVVDRLVADGRAFRAEGQIFLTAVNGATE